MDAEKLALMAKYLIPATLEDLYNIEKGVVRIEIGQYSTTVLRENKGMWLSETSFRRPE